jgi:uncharacterized protein YndB with AHSA1/START domain
MSQDTDAFSVAMSGDREIVMTRAFDAPRELVFAAHSQAEHLKRWWGRGNELDVTLDFRTGGSYRFVEHADGGEHGFHGDFLEIVPGEKIVQTFEYEGMPGHVLTETVLFEEKDGRTIITSTSVFASQEDRDGMAASGMADGARQSYDALDQVLKSLV